MAVTVAGPDARERLYKGLMRRNRIVDVLRWLVPALGAAVLAFVIGAMVLDTLAHRFGFASISVDRDNLVLETPMLTATGADGTLFALRARTAKVSMAASDFVNMQDAAFTMTPANGAEMRAEAAEGRLQTNDQLVDVPGVMHVSSSDGIVGTLEGVFADLMNWTMAASGPVNLSMSDGSTLVSNGMTYDRTTGLYTFKDVTVTLTMTPGEDQ